MQLGIGAGRRVPRSRLRPLALLAGGALIALAVLATSRTLLLSSGTGNGNAMFVDCGAHGSRLPVLTAQQRAECHARAHGRLTSKRVTDRAYGGAALTATHALCTSNHFIPPDRLGMLGKRTGGRHVPLDDGVAMHAFCDKGVMPEKTWATRCYNGLRDTSADTLPMCTVDYRRCFDEAYALLSPPSATSGHRRLCDASGGDGDAHKSLCGFDAARQSERTRAALGSGACVIYSVGGNNQWEFEEEMLAATACAVHTFDCTISAQLPPALAASGRFSFHPWCIGGDDDSPAAVANSKGWMAARTREVALRAGAAAASGGVETPETVSLLSAMARLGHDTVDLLKMDIEGYEYGVWKSLLRSHHEHQLAGGCSGDDDGACLRLPYQIAFEQHAGDTETGELRDRLDLVEVARNVADLGYVVVDRVNNDEARTPGGAVEVTAVLAWC